MSALAEALVLPVEPVVWQLRNRNNRNDVALTRVVSRGCPIHWPPERRPVTPPGETARTAPPAEPAPEAPAAS